MNFLREVLSSAEQTDIETGKEKLPQISAKIASCKEDINQYIDEVYRKYKDWPKKNQHLLDTTAQLTSDIEHLQKRVEEVTVKVIEQKTDELNNLSVELERSNVALGIVVRLVQIHELFKNVKDSQKKNLCVQAAFELFNVTNFIKGIPDDEATEAIEALKLNVVREKGVLMEKMIELFEENVKIVRGKPGNVQTNVLKIRRECKEFKDILAVLGLFEMATIPLNKFSKLFWEYLGKPVFDHIVMVKTEDDDEYHVLHLSIKKTKIKSPHKDVFSKLIELFTFLHASFNYQVNENLKTMDYIGEQIRLDVSQEILKKCLRETLPATEEECKAYKQTIQDVKKFQSKLRELEIFDEGANPLSDHVNNMSLLLMNQQCHDYSTASIAIMKKDLHDMVEVGVSHGDGPLVGDEFPRSYVSKSVLELLELMEKLFRQAMKEPDALAACLICTAQSIFYQYGNIVVGHHEKLLQTIPQQVVLFRNDCMYLAHQLTHYNDIYSKEFSQAALPVPPLFKDQPHHLRTVGGDVFLGYVEDHIKCMEATLDLYQVNSTQLSGQLHVDVDKCLRQCVRQYELLRTVWQKVLPTAVYNKTLGYMVNAFCKKLIDVVVGAQDIPSKNAEHLVDMYKVVLTRGPKLFTDPQDVGLYVESWQKLNDLVFVLGATLISIEDRWANGKGPLTLYFSAEEVKNLIKALFQNTDRRAAVLNKIHN